MRNIFPKDKEPLRDQIFELVNKSQASIVKILKTLEQCASHIRNRLEVERIVSECGLKSDRFLATDAMELYYDLVRDHRNIGYISKGWADPGFRIGDVIKVEKSNGEAFKANAAEIHDFCVTNGIGMTVKEEENAYDIQMDDVVYSEGFNKDTFLKTLDTLAECVEKAQTFYKKASQTCN